MKHALAAALTLLVISVTTSAILAKGPTTRITISGGDLSAPIEISDRQILRAFNVWSGPGTFINGVEAQEGFIIDWSSGVVTERPTGLPRYEVSFYVRHKNHPVSEQRDELAYFVSYEPDATTGVGYVYLPGKTDERSGINGRSIYRGGREGNWFRATDEWQRAMKRFL
jgi:hypothetical protein